MVDALTFVLTDVEQSVWVPSLELDETSLPLDTGPMWRVEKRTLKGGLQDGVDLIEVDNGALSFTVVPTRGMGIWQGNYRGTFLGWDSPVRDPVHPAHVELNDRGGLGWLKGFNEWIVRCGLDSNGAPGTDVVIDNNGNEAEVFVPLHGKIANTPARKVSVTIGLKPPYSITVEGEMDEAMLFGPALRLNTSISTHLGSDSFTITDRVTNLNQKPNELELLYHCNYGPPLLEAGSRVVAPFKTVSPRDPRAQEGMGQYDAYAGPRAGFVEQVYFYELAGKRGSRDTIVLLKNKAGNLGSSLRFSLAQMPSFSLWKNTAAKADGYVTGLEPATNYPNAKRFERERGRVVSLGPGETRQIDLTVAVHDSRKAVKQVEQAIAQIQKTVRPAVVQTPIGRLSSAG
jgi:hypothetical protein